MSGIWSEAWSPRACPACERSGRVDSRTRYNVIDEANITTLLVRCTTCRYVETLSSTVTAEARNTLGKATRRARVILLAAIGEAVAIGAMAVGAVALANMR